MMRSRGMRSIQEEIKRANSSQTIETMNGWNYCSDKGSVQLSVLWQVQVPSSMNMIKIVPP